MYSKNSILARGEVAGGGPYAKRVMAVIKNRLDMREN
jgi:hypothetical protein